MKVLTKMDRDIRKSHKEFKKPTARAGFGKAMLWILRPIHYTLARGHMALVKFDANTDAPEPSKIAFAEDMKEDLIDIQESISDHSKTLSKVEKELDKAKSKLKDSSGKKRTKRLRRVEDLKKEVRSLKNKIGRNQELHAKLAKKLAKKGLLHD